VRGNLEPAGEVEGGKIASRFGLEPKRKVPTESIYCDEETNMNVRE